MNRRTALFFVAVATTLTLTACSTIQNHDMPAPQFSEQGTKP